jgi:uncharacterized repeat protein (TIGR03837 family)
MARTQIWDIFCTVIDNHGDLGVCWRLSRQLANAGHSVRLWVDDASALTWMAPEAAGAVESPSAQAALPRIRVLPWNSASDDALLADLPPADVWVEAFGCPLPEAFVAQAVDTRVQAPVWINLEYLSAEVWVPGLHGLPSPVMSGPAKGWTKHFFYPGFAPETGGLLRETDLLARQQRFDRAAWRQQHASDLAPDGLLISLFCYEPAALSHLLQQLVGTPHHLLVTPGRPLAAVQKALRGMTIQPNWSALPYTDQDGFDDMLWACDLNFVRGEDSWVRAIWAGQPFVWQVYPQDDHAHHDKLAAFMNTVKAPASWQQAHRAWNGIETSAWPPLDAALLFEWARCARAAQQALLLQDDLQSQLCRFVANLLPPPSCRSRPLFGS